MRIARWIPTAGFFFLLAACGGGGGNGSAQVPAPTPINPPSAPASSTSVSQASPSALPVASTATNTVPIRVSSGLYETRNLLMTSVKVCTPGTNATANCSTIDNVLVDTESFGLRLFASAVPTSTLASLPMQAQSQSGLSIAECAIFASGYVWGTVRSADIAMSGEVAQNVPVQLIGDPSLSVSAPTDCQLNIAYSAPWLLGANGLLGVGVRSRDCGSQCATSATAGFYYACGSNACTATSLPVNQQVANPVQFFSGDNNGVVIELPPIAYGGATSVQGTLVFGIDTQPNNTLAGTGATLLSTDGSGNFNATYNGVTYPASAAFDTGSPEMFFQNTGIAVNSAGFYSPASAMTQSVAISGSNAASTASATINFDVGSASNLLQSLNYAFNDLDYYLPNTFEFGLPFFYGRHVYYGIAGAPSNGG
ncbi:DUF3443 domain-containing protein [Paraburkholderia bryophila]|uniref:DUF3443 family protein n=1 Tax=Paraburkholderia bryophila TaxID=420952 RepID=UPI002349E605|nr:DUF3443 family protein [Paraburkholderia bryophila]WCM22585.1 DUF3443 domain-containing protein [Paraburkholderia bryophila]